MPPLHSEDEELLLKLPTNFQEAQAVKATLALYKENYSGLVIALLICLYLFMQVHLTSYLLDGIHSLSVALFNPKTSFLIQKRHPYTGNSETPGDSKNAFLHWGDVLGSSTVCHTCAFSQVLQTLDIMHPSSCCLHDDNNNFIPAGYSS